MAAIQLSAVGSKYGPCVESCGHRDCALTRSDLELPCEFCHRPLGSEVLVYTSVPAHAACYEEAVEDERVDRARDNS